ncbi:hypothetical protein RMATCC62417_09607 [Rhizopus microsporus]|nr:hypothetical protein RMATCC62417_09607 [Rhizopus microsporus]
MKRQLPSSEKVVDTKLTSTEEKSSMQDYTVQDFESLIYANAITKRPKEAEKAFDLMQKYNILPSTRAVNHLIDAYANVNDLPQAISAFKRLRKYNLKPDIYTYSSIIKAFVASKRIDDALVIFERMKNSSIIPSQPIFANIISGCLKANKVKKAWEVFDTMRLSYHQPDEVSYTLMLHACAKVGEVEKSLNLFEDMVNYQLYPTDVTFNVLINACAKRPDYYHEAFSLLNQMEEHYGFQPDRITYNTLLTACSRKKDLPQARNILNVMWNDMKEKGADSLLAPDEQTFTNLLWCYASYQPTRSADKISEATSSSTALTTTECLISTEIPRKRSDVAKEARWLFKLAVSHNIKATTALLNAYLTVHISQKQSTEAVNIYTKMFDKFAVKKDGFTFSQMLEYCYKQKDGTLAWKVWEDYQTFLESKHQEFDIKENVEESIMEKKARQTKKEAAAVREGWADQQQRELFVTMANTLARVNDLKNALSIIATELRRCSNLGAPSLSELMPVYNKCIQLEDEEARQTLIRLCPKNKTFKNSKFKRVYT